MRIQYNDKARLLWISRPDQAIEEKLDAEYERVQGHLQWKVPPDGATLTRAKDFLVAKVSGKLNPDDPIVLQRLESCKPCTALKTDPGGSWCGACGCGRVLMILSDGSPGPKTLYKTLKCPRRMPGFSNGG